jgi:hypothetical protein
MDKRLYPISEEFFNEKINPLIVSAYSAAGRPQKISNYQVHPEIPPHPIFHLLPQNFLTIFFYQKSRGHPSFSGK